MTVLADRAFQPLPTALPARYLPIDIIGQGGMGIVYRVVDRLEGTLVALKQLKPSLEMEIGSRSSAERLTMAHEFRLLSALRHPYILPALDFGFGHDGTTYVTMPLLEHPLSVFEFGAQQPLSVRITLFLQLLQAVTYLHRHGVIHNDLKPSNILILNERVHIVDFGISSLVGEQRPIQAGTPRYIAPELLRGASPSQASDWYSIGMIAYELFTTSDDQGHNSWERKPASADAEQLPIDPQLREIIADFLSEDPDQRMANLPVFPQLYQQWGEGLLPYTEFALQESFLRHAPLVGRDADMATLRRAIDRLMHGVGGLWLVGGESGIGKSRLLDELRIEALVANIHVARGQARSELAHPFQVLEQVIRWLMLLVEVQTNEAAILKIGIPSLDLQVEQRAPDIEPQAMQRRFLDVVEALFRRNPAPLMVILEDVHWLNAESIEFFSKLTQRLSDTLTLFVFSYRNDEQPHLIDVFPHAEHLQLSRLPGDQVHRLMSSLFGHELPDTFLHFFERETNGNPFFVVEVTRALAEAVGGLQHIMLHALPNEMAAVGRDNVLQHRIQMLPAFAQELLPLAAVMGRTLDETLLRQLAPDSDVEQWLIVCTERHVLEADGNGWRFAHDRIRESILGQLTNEQRAALHLQVAACIEKQHQPDYQATPALAYHWAQAGIPAKEAYYVGLAGESYFRQSNYQAAVQYLTRAHELREYFAPEQHARYGNLLGEALYASGYMIEGEKQLYHALLGYELSPPSLIQISQQSVRQLWYRLSSRRATQQTFPAAYRERVSMIVRACEKLAQINYIRNQKLASVYYALQGLNLSESLGVGAEAEQARYYASMSLAFGLVAQHTLARYYLRQADALASSVKNADALAWAYEATATYEAGCGQWKEAEMRYQKCIQLSDSIGNKRRVLEATGFLAVLFEYSGRWDDLPTLYTHFTAANPYNEDQQARCWQLVPQGTDYLLRGDAELALDLISELSALVAKLDDKATQMRGLGFLTLYYVHYGLAHVAQEYAAQLMDIITHTTPVVFATLSAYIACAAFYLHMWMVDASADQRTKALQACRGLNAFARSFAIGRPYAQIYMSWYYLQLGNLRKAARHSDIAVMLAQQLKMPDAETTAYALRNHLNHVGLRIPQRKEASQTPLATRFRADVLLPGCVVS